MIKTVFRQYLASGAFEPYVMGSDSESALKNTLVRVGFNCQGGGGLLEKILKVDCRVI